jgi:hypothetical protein
MRLESERGGKGEPKEREGEREQGDAPHAPEERREDKASR